MIASCLRALKTHVLLLGVILLAGLAATWALARIVDGREGTDHDRLEVARMTHKMKTICIGRFLLEMPRETRVALGQASIDGIDISVVEETAIDFQQRLAERETRIIGKPDRHGGNGHLESVTQVLTGEGVAGKIFVHSRKVLESSAANGHELERGRYQPVVLEALTHGGAISIDFYAERYDPGKTQNLATLVNQLVPNSENRFPAEPGYCIDRAYFRDPLRPDQLESVIMLARLPSHPDVQFRLALAAGRKSAKQGLIERTAASTSRMRLRERLHFRAVRAAPREVGGLLGEEVVQSVTEENGARIQRFWWEVDGAEDDVTIPHLVFQMTTGHSKNGPVPSSLSFAASLELWEAVSSSIRLRSTDDSNSSRNKRRL